MKKQTCTVLFERGDRPNQWVASLKELPECHTFGRGLAQTRARIREALALWEGEDVASHAELEEVLPLPRSVNDALAELEKLNGLRIRIQERAGDVVAELRDDDWAMRDVGEVLQLSHQRVHQVARRKPKVSRKKKTGGRKAAGRSRSSRG